MKRLISILNLRTLYGREQIKPTIILIMAALLPVLHRYFGSMEFALKTFSSISEFEASVYMFVAAFVFMGILPLAIVHFAFQEPLRSYGLNIGHWRIGLPITAILFVLIAVIMIYPASQTAEIRTIFPFDKSAGDSIFAFLRFQALRGLFFYSSWEFFFRGFMLFGLRRYFGDWMAICIQAIPSCMWHIGMPAGEIFSSLVAGILFGILAIRTRSILWVFLLHYLIGIALDLFIVMTL